jgi:PST family polysaccharide transporter
VQPVANLTGVLFISNNEERRMMHWGIASAVVTLIAFVIGLRWGAVGVAAAFFWSAALRLPALYWFVAKNNAVRTIDLWRVQVEPLVGAAIAAVFANRLLGHWSLVSILALTIPLAYLLSLGSSMCLSSDGRNQTRELLSIAARYFAHKMKR